MSWQDEQDSVPLEDRRGSENRRSPSASLFGSATGGWGTAEIGSSSNGFVHVPCGFCGRPGVCEGAWVAAPHARASARQIKRDRRRARLNVLSNGCRRRKAGEHDRAI